LRDDPRFAALLDAKLPAEAAGSEGSTPP